MRRDFIPPVDKKNKGEKILCRPLLFHADQKNEIFQDFLTEIYKKRDRCKNYEKDTQRSNDMEEPISVIISRLDFVEATTMKNIPHEYTVKSYNKRKEYEALYNYIFENHYIKYFYGKPYKYCDIGNHTYWIMSDDINTSKIINRVERK